MNKQEILAKLQTETEFARRFFYDEFHDIDSVLTQPKWYSDEFIEFVSLLHLSGCGFIQRESFGGEGMGDSYWTVYEFTTSDESFFVQFDGSYASYSGEDYNECFEVEPKEVTVTQYVKKPKLKLEFGFQIAKKT